MIGTHTSKRARTAITASVDSHRLELIDGGRARLDAILQMIDGAMQSLRLLFYMFSEDEAGEAVLGALVRAAMRGVEIDLLVDGFGSSHVAADFFEPLREAGGRYRLFHPSYGRRYLIRNHQKMAIADGETALIGGANIDVHYLQDDGDARWQDLWLRVEGPAVGELAAYFDDINGWTGGRHHRFRDLRRIIQRHSHGKGAVSWRFSGPMRRRNPWPGTIAREIDHGRRLDIMAAYFSPSWAMLRRIGRLALRGEARIINAARSDNSATIAAARHTYHRLLRRGVELFEYQPAKLHTKLYVVDDTVHLGSSNFDFRSLYLNLEMMLRVEDAAFAAQMREFIDRQVVDCTHITRAVHHQRATVWRRFKWWLSHWLVTTVDYTVTRRINFGVE